MTAGLRCHKLKYSHISYIHKVTFF